MEATLLSLEGKNIQSVMYLSLEMICKEYQFDRGCVFLQNIENNTFFKAFECNLVEMATNYLAVRGMKFDEYLHQTVIENIKTPESLKNLFGQNSYLYTKNFYSIDALMDTVQFEKKNEEIFEFFTFPLNGYIGYITFEKSVAEKLILSVEDIVRLTEMCKFLSYDIEKLTFENHISEWKKLIQIQKNILDNEKFHVHIIKKDTYELLYFNKSFKKVFPDAEMGKSCCKLKGYSLPCSDSFINSRYFTTNEYCGKKEEPWLIRSEVIHWTDNTEAYLIYTRETESTYDDLRDLDHLTGTLTTTQFKMEYEHIIKNSDFNYAYFVFDIEKFKYINDTWGYSTGDEILKKVKSVLDNLVQKDEVYCRLGNDRFALILQCEDRLSIDKRVETLNYIFENMQKLFFREITISITCGIYFSEKKREFEYVANKANIARKSIKGSHKNSFKVYDRALENFAENEKLIEDRMYTALENGEFIPYLQPKVNLYTKEICGAEALVRWQAYDRMIYPDEFISVFEKNGFITVLDFVIYEKVMQYIRKCLDEGIAIYPISLNASRAHITDKKFINKLLTLIEKYKIPLHLIEIEVTEGVLVEDKLSLNNFIKELRNNDIIVSVDDFGTAYSSLNLLKDIEVDVIKIDKEFLHAIDLTEPIDIMAKDKVVIRHIVQMAKELEFSIICEGVETLAQVEFLKEIGCEYGQGYVFARPMTMHEFETKFLIT